MQGISHSDSHRKAKGLVLNKMASQHIHVQADDSEEEKVAILLQARWRSRQARLFCSALRQESACKQFRCSHPVIEGEERIVAECDICTAGETGASVSEKLSRRQYQDVQRLLFTGQKKMTVDDTGDNWNMRFQSAVDMPEKTRDEAIAKYQTLSAINQDFVASATRYAKTIISEYFLHAQHKSIRAKNFGGFAGGQVRSDRIF